MSTETVQDDVLFYHKIQKTGSTTMDTLLKKFSESRGFGFKYYPAGAKRLPIEEKVMELYVHMCRRLLLVLFFLFL